jgi:antitoxin component YwqK of YwqJK toxin-antitoxin module
MGWRSAERSLGTAWRLSAERPLAAGWLLTSGALLTTGALLAMGALVAVGGCADPPPLDCPAGSTLNRATPDVLACTNEGGIQIGPYLRHHPGGEVAETGRYDDEGRRTGEWTRFRVDGSRARAETWLAGGMHGSWAEWDADGKKTFSGSYVIGNKDGRWWDWAANGRPTELTTWEQGRPGGPAVRWHEDGDVAQVGHHVSGTKAGLWLAWHESGGLRSSISFADGLEHGPVSSWYADGTPRRQAVFHRGLVVTDQRWSLGGRRIERREGRERESWSLDGVRTRWCRPVEGDVDLCETWYDTGVRKSTGRQRAGRPEGEVQTYDEEGRLDERRIYREGLRVPTDGALPPFDGG